MELSRNYLHLKLHRLEAGDQMDLKGRGLLFLILKAGSGSCHSGPLAHRLGPGDVLVLDSASGGRFQIQDRGQTVFWFFAAEFEHLFPLFTASEICLLRNVAEGFKAGKVYLGGSPLAKDCLRLVDEVPAQFSLDHRSHVLRIVSAILTAEFKSARPKLGDLVPMRDQVLQLFEQLQTDDLLCLSVGNLAKKFSCSRRHLNRLFHQYFGLSVAALRMEMRLLKAVSLLSEPDAKIIHVAEKCGFNHLGLFNTCFKKRFGTSPSQLRKTFSGASTVPQQTMASNRTSQGRAVISPSEVGGASVMQAGQNRPLERVALSGLLKDIAAAKGAFGPHEFSLKTAHGLGFAADGKGDTKARAGA
jgi:AraC-like DNA-binding protein